MTYQTLDQYNTTDGMHTLLSYTADVVPIFIPMILFAIFTISCIGSYFASIRMNNVGDFPASFAAAGFITSIIATMMGALDIINLSTLSLTYGITIMGVLWLYFSRD